MEFSAERNRGVDQSVIVKDLKLLARMHREASLCEWCENVRDGLECHHIRPKGMGGGSRLDVGFNIAMLCRACHEAFQANKIPGREGRPGRPSDAKTIQPILWGIAAEREVRRLLRLRKEDAA